MRLYRILSRQQLPTTLEQAWDFCSTPRNLPAITPEWLHFTVTSDVPDRMYPGLAMTYSITPVPFWRVEWLTVITAIDEGRNFVDEQRTGPYRLWHHEHRFEPVDGGVEMRDVVHYALPLDPLSRPLHDYLVRRQLQDVFEYRFRSLARLFGPDPAGHTEAPPGAIVFAVV